MNALNRWLALNISALMALFPPVVLSAETFLIPKISTVRSNCIYLSSSGRCEKTCHTGYLYMQVPDGSFVCVKQIVEDEKNK